MADLQGFRTFSNVDLEFPPSKHPAAGQSPHISAYKRFAML